jgi:hypothetical protein
MASRLRKVRIGEKVKVKSTVFDSAADVRAGRNRWSQVTHGDLWDSSYEEGIIVESLGKSIWLVQFSDAKTEVHRQNIITLDNEGPLRPNFDTVTRFEADLDVEVADVEDSDSSSEDEVTTDINKLVEDLRWSDEEQAPTFDQRTKKGFTTQENPIFHPKYIEKRSGPTVFEVWQTWTNEDFMHGMVEVMDAAGRAKYSEHWRTLTMGKFVRWLGIYHQMLADPRPGGRRSYWSNMKDWECLGRSSYDLKDVMDIKEFEQIYTVFGIPIGAPDDAHGKVRGFVDAWNSQCKKALSPGWCLVIDESMVKWRGRGMPGKIFVPRKPEPCGMEGKTTACGLSKCMLHFDMQEGKNRMGDKKYNKEYGRSVGCTLRCVDSWAGKGKVVFADSWFGSPKAAIALAQRGLFCIMNVKGAARKGFPMERMQENVSQDKRIFSLMSSFTINDEELSLVAGGHQEKNPMFLISTASTMHMGDDRRFKIFFLDDNGTEQTSIVTYTTTEMHGAYRKYFNRIDLHNRDRQENFYFAEVLITNDWSKRVIWELWGCTLVNVHFTLQYFYGAHYRNMCVQQFKDAMAMGLMYNPWIIAERIDRPIVQGSHTLVRMPARKSNPKLMVNTICRYCKQCTSYYCEQCTRKNNITAYFGVCNVGIRMCWANHVENVPTPRNRARGGSLKRARLQ